jgi:lysine 2,3-aminomutase
MIEDDPDPSSRRPALWADVPDDKWNDWRWQMAHRLNNVDELAALIDLTPEEITGLTADDKFRVDITPYFASLIDPHDPTCPIRRQVIPLGRELRAFNGMMEDSLAEDKHSPVPGLVHRYPDRVLMLITTQCASYCRYCTRSRIVGNPAQTFSKVDFDAQIDYLRRTPQVRDVLLSGVGLAMVKGIIEGHGGSVAVSSTLRSGTTITLRIPLG